MKHPMQPIYDDDGVERFKANRIVRWLLDAGPFDMNTIAVTPFEVEDREQFAQLIGYSVSGFSELPYVRDETLARAEYTLADKLKDLLSYDDLELRHRLKELVEEL